MSIDTSRIWDQQITVVSISKLHEVIRDRAIQFILSAQLEGVYLRIPTNGGYISYEEQQNNFNKGLTCVQGGGTYHNFGLAFDVLPLDKTSFTLEPRSLDNKRTLSNEKWEKIGFLATRLGFEWGGEWANSKEPHPKFDSAHFQLPRTLISEVELKELRESQGVDLVVLPDEINKKFNMQL